jgi:sugar O-acyltransferase (sialic acid O-acetyltransferase NeuD family)
MAKVVIFGVGQLADIAHYYLDHDSPHATAAFSVNRQFISEPKHNGLPVVPFEEIRQKYPPHSYRIFAPISAIRVNKFRAEIFTRAREMGYSFISYVSSRATVWQHAQVGENCFITENAVVQPFAKIGNDVVIWGDGFIGHHSVIGDHCLIASNAVIAGNVTVGPYCFIGVNATVRDYITVAPECVIGAGTLILRNTVEQGVYIGQPAAKYVMTSSELNRI